MIYIENTYNALDEEEIKQFAGICLDFSHLECRRIYNKEKFSNDIKLIEKYDCCCNHLGPIKNWNFLDKEEEKKHPSSHILDSLSEFDYLKRYPLDYFGEYLAIEIENSIKEQLKAKEYIIKLLKNNEKNKF